MIWKLNNPQLAKSKAIDSTLNTLENTKSLVNLFEKLYLLKTDTSNQKIVFTHIGDSHIQADKITSILRNEFQDYFGNGGRGVLFAFQVAKTNSPLDIVSYSSNQWVSSRLSKISQAGNCGITAYGIKTNPNEATIELEVKDSLKNSFDQLSIFYAKGLKSILIESAIFKKVQIVDSNSQFTSLALPSLHSKIKLTFAGNQCQPIEFFGLSVSKNKEKGIVYHSIGSNGAKISDYNEAPLFWEQLPELKSDCFLISLGTNEAQNQNLSAELYINQLKIMVEKIKIISPDAAVIVLSPPVSYFKKMKPNKSLPIIATSIKEFCYQNNLAFWDFFQISKGLRGAGMWRKLKLLNTDLVHFTNAGYAIQGALLAEAFAKSFNEFTSKK